MRIAFTYIFWIGLISSRCETSNTPLTLVGQEISGWSISGSISVGTECPRKFTRICSYQASDTKLEVSFKRNSIPQNRLIRWGLHFTYIL